MFHVAHVAVAQHRRKAMGGGQQVVVVHLGQEKWWQKKGLEVLSCLGGENKYQIWDNTIQYNTIQYNTIQYNTIIYDIPYISIIYHSYLCPKLVAEQIALNQLVWLPCLPDPLTPVPTRSKGLLAQGAQGRGFRTNDRWSRRARRWSSDVLPRHGPERSPNSSKRVPLVPVDRPRKTRTEDRPFRSANQDMLSCRPNVQTLMEW